MITGVGAGLLLALAYAVRRAAQAGKTALADPQLQDWLRREQALKAGGEWRLDPEARLVLPAAGLQAEVNRYQKLRADLALIPLNRQPEPPELAALQPYLGQELVWRFRYHSLKQGRRSDLQPGQGSPTLAILELPESFPGGAVAQVGRQLYLIYRPGAVIEPTVGSRTHGVEALAGPPPKGSPPSPAFGQSSPALPVPVMMHDNQVVWADGRRFYWRPAETFFEARSFLDEDGQQIITFYQARLRIDPAAPPDVAPILALLDYYLYSSPVHF